jgi:hypothetical protein
VTREEVNPAAQPLRGLWRVVTRPGKREMKTYLVRFDSEKSAMDRMRLKNRACRMAGNRRDIYAVVPGPEGDWAVVDIKTAIELGAGYRWEVA